MRTANKTFFRGFLLAPAERRSGRENVRFLRQVFWCRFRPTAYLSEANHCQSDQFRISPNGPTKQIRRSLTGWIYPKTGGSKQENALHVLHSKPQTERHHKKRWSPAGPPFSLRYFALILDRSSGGATIRPSRNDPGSSSCSTLLRNRS